MASISLKYKSKSGNLTAPGDIDPGAMIPLATTVVGAGGSTSVTFSNISQNYEHLQLRVFAQVTRATYGRGGYTIRVNSDSGTNYSQHDLNGDGTTVAAVGYQDQTQMALGLLGTTTSNTFGVTIIDFLDYSNTNKFKTVRSIGGVDHNGSISGFNGWISLNSNVWRSTSGINSILITPDYSPFTQYSHFALYGIKRAGA